MIDKKIIETVAKLHQNTQRIQRLNEAREHLQNECIDIRIETLTIVCEAITKYETEHAEDCINLIEKLVAQTGVPNLIQEKDK